MKVDFIIEIVFMQRRNTMDPKNYVAPTLEVISVSEFCGEISACGGTLMTTRLHCRHGKQEEEWCENGYL